jgi:hypothetical protein
MLRLFLAFAASVFAQTAGPLEGRVVNSTTRAGIGEVRVTLRSLLEQRTFTATTDTSGAFRFASLPRGEYVPSFQNANYIDRTGNLFSIIPGRDPVRLGRRVATNGKAVGAGARQCGPAGGERGGPVIAAA